MNAPIKPINAAHEALLNSDDALCVDAVAAATGMKKRYAAKQIKQLAGLGLIEPEFRAGGVPFYRLISAPAAPAPSERVLTPEAQAERDQFDLEVADRGCTCFISPPCGYCTHPGNPRNQEEDETAWMTVSDSEGGEADAPAADADGWIPWVATADSVCPVPDGTRVRMKLNNGIETAENSDDLAERIIWHALPTASVVAYKIIAQAPADFATTPELQYLEPEDYADMPPADPDFLAQANRALGEQLEAANNLVTARGNTINSLRFEVAVLKDRLDSVYKQSIADTDALTQQIEHLRAELETARAEAIALKTLEGAMPGFGAEYDAQRIASLTAELQALRTSNANAINEADRLRADLAKASIDLGKNVSGYLVCATKRKPRRINDGERAKVAALAAVRAGAARAEVLAVVPVGTARRGAEWRAK